MDNQSGNPQVSHFQTTPSLPLPFPAGLEGAELPSAPAIGQDMPQNLPPVPDDSLLGIKQQALASLTPLVSRLEQSPEERFKTTMMLIQASDNPTLIKEAYAAANLIADDKARAQALIDVVNEINYFTQKAGKGKE